MSVDHCIQLFRGNFADAGICAKLAVGLFGGMRTTAVARLEWADLRFSLNAVETPGWKTKTGARDLIQGWPSNVWKWIARAKQTDFAAPCPDYKDKVARAAWKKQCDRRWMHQKSDALKRAGLLVTSDDPVCKDGVAPFGPPSNWARHSFATYHATAYHDLGLTATLMSHAETVDTLRKHYLGVVEQPEALRFFQITPRMIAKLIG